ncbi:MULTISPECIES: hypothetical protein [Paenibacillus]|uniref:hypothetical protein n=1 Tax=Paenibacillus TaxID=44249 RepID=UPI0022B90200|nr:hypothetical protein [Paenibacillus caseinilyticus]MCZ8523103.1 hypothetical protein [Paenibacillus caseinilyticus]
MVEEEQSAHESVGSGTIAPSSEGDSVTREAGAKPKRGRKSKTPSLPDPLEGLDVEGTPHLQGMSPAWQRLYAAVAQAAKSIGP